MTQHLPIIDMAQLIGLVNNPRVQLIDVRPVDSYNGWCFDGERRGGHISGARSLPAHWCSYIDWLDIIHSKGIRPDRPVILYGRDRAETEHVGAYFLRAGFGDVRLYHDFIDRWSAQLQLPMNTLARYSKLVSPRWLATLRRTGRADEFDNDRVVVCHAHYRNPDAYTRGHIPGAIELDTNTLESPLDWNRRSPAELKAAFEQHGITADTTVILYGRFSSPQNSDAFPGSNAGQLAAMRCAFIMLYAGVGDVRVLNGGLRAWIDAGYETTTTPTAKTAVAEYGLPIPQHPELAVDIAEARQMLVSADANLVCVRSWPEYIGEVSGYNYIEKRGRIPGAVFGNCGSDAYHMENYRNLDHTTREYHEIDRLWNKAGICAEKHNAFYCGTGWRGSEAFFNGWLMGWPRVSVFDGGWYEWSSDPDNPTLRGFPEKQNTEPSLARRDTSHL